MVRHASIFLAFVMVTAATSKNGVLISVENRIETFSEAGNSSLVVTGAKHIIGLSNPVYTNNEFSSIFATELGTRGPSVYQISKDSQVLLADPAALAATSELPSYFEAIAFDQQTNQLFLTSKNAKTIYKMSANKGGQPKPFISTEYKKPTGISIDPCSRNVFWTNSDRKTSSIEVFQPDTGSGWTVINTNLTRPKAITVDTPERKLYWTDTNRGRFWISRSNLDGMEREVVCEGKDHEAFSIAVSQEYIYWSDWTSHALWRTTKSGDCNFELVRKFTTSKPHGISLIPDTKYNCGDYHDIIKKPTVTTNKEHPAETTLKPAKDDDDTTNATHKTGKEGACANYCLNGNCLLMNGEPVCDCSAGYTGPRCQTNKCFNFCLEDGQCFVIEDEPECLCSEGFMGDRCQAAQLLVVNENQPSFANASSSLSSTVSGDVDILVFVLGGTTGALTIVVIVLSVFLNKLRLRPRVVRKRFISVAGANRKEDKPSNSCGLPVDDGIQLDIENCCNMTLCDTPCFEPPNRGPKKDKKSKSPKGGDKKSLLADEDEDY
eukprot:GFUD01026790.1.p1 GENE.GFUD01026790.1~~GFUD01026790.1.p1  ORF type:complete len:549 (+),score=105.74 GFUD01026790.1:228-1874(+)